MARRLPAALAMTSVLIVTVLVMPAARPLLHSIFPDLPRPIYTRATFLDLMIAHLRLVVIATGSGGGGGDHDGRIRHAAGRSFVRATGTHARDHRPDLSAGCRLGARRADARLRRGSDLRRACRLTPRYRYSRRR